MPKETVRARKTKPQKPYKLQVLFPEEDRRMLESLMEQRRVTASVLVRQLILEAFLRTKG